MDATVDYGEAFAAIERIITGKRRFLIEALAWEVARALADRFPTDPPMRDNGAQAQCSGAWRA
jgi:dihydroneopterin aldolase